MSDFLDNAQRILETAASTPGEAATESLAILIGAEGGIHIVMGSDWPLDSLRAHHGAPALFLNGLGDENAITRNEPLGKPETYLEFFQKLSKAVFLQANEF